MTLHLGNVSVPYILKNKRNTFYCYRLHLMQQWFCKRFLNFVWKAELERKREKERSSTYWLTSKWLQWLKFGQARFLWVTHVGARSQNCAICFWLLRYIGRQPDQKWRNWDLGLELECIWDIDIIGGHVEASSITPQWLIAALISVYEYPSHLVILPWLKSYFSPLPEFWIFSSW